ncbi:MAG: Rieske 2Fe-2S domain-containing protein [Ilumatobacter sp.]|uniref:Rieske 2Fe-2S domain-containing protein n=1 Tax=Ilumatobacter sp. TaxID=1967498 RepID=UPI00391BF1F3
MLISEVPAFRDYWYPIAYSADIADEPVAFRIFGEQYVAWRAGDGTVQAAVDECPHRAARLSQGWVTDGCLTCPYHGWRFDADGRCVEIPSADPALPIPPRAHVDKVLAGERYELVWVCVGMPRADIPDLHEADTAGYTLIHEMMEVWTASAPRIIDNALDVSHAAWVHRNSIGSSANPRLESGPIERDGSTINFSVTMISQINDSQQRNTGLDVGLTRRTTHATLVQPFVFRGRMVYEENGLEHVLFKTCTPIDDETTLFCQFIARNDDPPPELWDSITAVDRQVQAEDKALLEHVNPNFPIEPTTELHTKADRMTLEYRKVLAELAATAPHVAPDAEWATGAPR